MAINFPSNPQDGAEYTDADSGTWVYDSNTNSWTLKAAGSANPFNYRGGHDFSSSTVPANVESGDMWNHDGQDGATIDAAYTGMSGTIAAGQLVLYDGDKYVKVSSTPGYPNTGDGNGSTLDDRYLRLKGKTSQEVDGNVQIGGDAVSTAGVFLGAGGVLKGARADAEAIFIGRSTNQNKLTFAVTGGGTATFGSDANFNVANKGINLGLVGAPGAIYIRGDVASDYTGIGLAIAKTGSSDSTIELRNDGSITSAGDIWSDDTTASKGASLKLTSGSTWGFRSNKVGGTNEYGLDIYKGAAGTDIKLSIDRDGTITAASTINGKSFKDVGSPASLSFKTAGQFLNNGVCYNGSSDATDGFVFTNNLSGSEKEHARISNNGNITADGTIFSGAIVDYGATSREGSLMGAGSVFIQKQTGNNSSAIGVYYGTNTTPTFNVRADGRVSVDLGQVTNPGKFTDCAVVLDNATNVGDYSQIGFGYTGQSTQFASAYIGYVSTLANPRGMGDLVFGTRGSANDEQPTERFRIKSDGNITAAGSVSIGGTDAAHTISEYEEGTWTPEQNPSWFNNKVQLGKYTKIGNVVTVSCHWEGELTDDSATNAQTSMTLPFVIDANVPGAFAISVINGGSDFGPTNANNTSIFMSQKPTGIGTAYTELFMGLVSRSYYPNGVDVRIEFNISYTTNQ